MLKAPVIISMLARNDVESVVYYIGVGVGTDVEINVILQRVNYGLLLKICSFNNVTYNNG